MGALFETTPAPFGAVHLAILTGTLGGCVALYFLLRNRSEKSLLRLIFFLGLGMVIAEVWKQWFVPRYVYTDGPSSWFFPWQLCSMAMYCSVTLPLWKGRAQNTVLVFLATFSLLAAVIALLIPGDMMRPQILLFCHSFLYHGVMLVESLAAILLLRRRARAPFWPALLLFCGMAAVAEVINVVSHRLIGDIHVEANMFYITPYYPSTQPVFHWIAVTFGILPEILLYLGAIALGSYGLYRLTLRQKKKPPMRTA